jgi:phosphoribosyl 1,2-cyclic phosphodiesterase
MPDERKISVITDTGIITQDIIDKATGSDLILLESNHDKEMLNNGPYPYHLKQRILSDKGHLSNEDCATAARHFVNTGTSRLVLGHLSRENNTATAAFNATNNALGKTGAIQGMDYILQVAPACVGERMVIL